MSTEAVTYVMQKSLPTSFYLSPQVFALEKELIFCQEWFCGGRVEQFPNAGDSMVLDVAGESILVARTRQGELKAHYNVCRHRGTRLCQEPSNSSGAQLTTACTESGVVRCPYHFWTYSLDGSLLGAPYLKESADFRKADFNLYPVGLEIWGGFFFLNLSPSLATKEDRNLATQLGPIPQRVRRYPLSELRTEHRAVYDVAANWKVIAENYNECYHCGGVHPELCEVVPAFKEMGGSNLDWENGIRHKEGAFTFTRSGTTNRAPFPGLDEFEKVRHKGELIYPNLMLSLAAEHVAAFTLWPVDTGHTRVICDFLFHPEQIAKPDFNADDAVEFWDVINRQDWAICERVQLGMQSRVHKFGYYAPMEDMSLDIRRYVRERLGETE